MGLPKNHTAKFVSKGRSFRDQYLANTNPRQGYKVYASCPHIGNHLQEHCFRRLNVLRDMAASLQNVGDTNGELWRHARDDDATSRRVFCFAEHIQAANYCNVPPPLRVSHWCTATKNIKTYLRKAKPCDNHCTVLCALVQLRMCGLSIHPPVEVHIWFASVIVLGTSRVWLHDQKLYGLPPFPMEDCTVLYLKTFDECFFQVHNQSTRPPL
jgi:hypothetical protein